MKSAPCKDCSDRHLGCHASCREYNKFTSERAEELKLISQKKQLEFFSTRH